MGDPGKASTYRIQVICARKLVTAPLSAIPASHTVFLAPPSASDANKVLRQVNLQPKHDGVHHDGRTNHLRIITESEGKALLAASA